MDCEGKTSDLTKELLCYTDKVIFF